MTTEGVASEPGSLTWTSATAQIMCRVCGYEGEATRIATVNSALVDDLDVIRCRECDSIQLLDSPREFSPDREFIDRYIELLAGIGTIAESLTVASPHAVTRFLDIGCNYPFSLDLARFLYGWDVLGVEPSPAGSRGGRELGVDVRSEYLSVHSDLGDRFDLILASEVIEHVPDPLEFLQIVRTWLAPGARVVLTTPAAEIVDPREDPGLALLAISPSYHVFLASARGMTMLLVRAGFAHCEVHRDRGTLKITAQASGSSFGGPPSGAAVSLEDLDKYYEWRGGLARSRSALAVGMWTRLLRLRVARGDFPGADRTRPHLFRAIPAMHGIDLRRPASITRNPRFNQNPAWSVAGSAFALGMAELLGRIRPRKAAEYFLLSERVSELALSSGKLIDADTMDLRFQAPFHRALALAQFDPAAAVELALNLEDSLAAGYLGSVRLVEGMQCRIFTEVTSRGAYAQALSLARVVGATALDVAGDSEPETRRAGLDALYSLGVSALNTTDAAGAAKWFTHCVSACDSGGVSGDAADLRAIAAQHLATARARLAAEAIAA